MTNANLATTAQSLNPGELVSLFRFDATRVGGTVMYFVQGSEVSGNISFGGIEYTAIDIEFEGMEVSGQGALPTPTIRLANAAGLPQSLINTYGDLLQCELRRIRTFGRHLDGGSDPDPLAYFGPDVFIVERKVAENNVYVEWELSASVDQEGKQLPGRVIVRDTCLWRYREWNGSSFDYSKAQCPYTGSNYFDINNVATANPALDEPSRTLTCCKKRFGNAGPWPFGGFPGAGRAR